MTVVTSAANLGAGVYTLTFNNPVTITATEPVQPDMLMYSPSEIGWTNLKVTSTPGTYTTITVFEENGDDDCTLLAVLQAPAGMTATPAFGVAAPIQVI